MLNNDTQLSSDCELLSEHFSVTFSTIGCSGLAFLLFPVEYAFNAYHQEGNLG